MQVLASSGDRVLIFRGPNSRDEYTVPRTRPQNSAPELGHIFVGEKPDFYEISDGLPQFEGSSAGYYKQTREPGAPICVGGF